MPSEGQGCNVYIAQRNDGYRGHTGLVQQFACRGSSHQRKGAGRHRIDNGLALSLADPSREEVGILGTVPYLFK